MQSHPRVAGQHRAAPLPRAAVLRSQPGSRDLDGHRAEGAGQLPLAGPVPVG